MQNSVACRWLATSASTSGFISGAPTSSIVSATTGLFVITPSVAIPLNGVAHAGSGGRLASRGSGLKAVAPDVAAVTCEGVSFEATGEAQPTGTRSRHAKMSTTVLRIARPSIGNPAFVSGLGMASAHHSRTEGAGEPRDGMTYPSRSSTQGANPRRLARSALSRVRDRSHRQDDYSRRGPAPHRVGSVWPQVPGKWLSPSGGPRARRSQP